MSRPVRNARHGKTPETKAKAATVVPGRKMGSVTKGTGRDNLGAGTVPKRPAPGPSKILAKYRGEGI